jgi:hypothetical protein
LLKEIVHVIAPDFQCISLIYADEAMQVIQRELKHVPSFIFIDADMKCLPRANCLQTLRKNKALDTCFIGIFSGTMPSAVADAYQRMGANAAFQLPITAGAGKEIFSSILKGEVNREVGADLKTLHPSFSI